MVPDGKKCGRTEWTDGRRKNYIPPTKSGDKKGTASVNTDREWSKQEACFACVTQVWLAVNHNNSITSGE